MPKELVKELVIISILVFAITVFTFSEFIFENKTLFALDFLKSYNINGLFHWNYYDVHNGELSDNVVLFLPQLEYFKSAYMSDDFTVPSRIPEVYTGIRIAVPYFNPFLDPTSLPMLIFDTQFGTMISVLIRFILVGYFTYFLSRSLRLSITGSMLAATIFLMSSNILWLSFFHYLASIMWIVLAFWLLTEALKRRYIILAVLTGWAIGTGIASQFTELWLYFSYISIIYAVWYGLGHSRIPGMIAMFLPNRNRYANTATNRRHNFSTFIRDPLFRSAGMIALAFATAMPIAVYVPYALSTTLVKDFEYFNLGGVTGTINPFPFPFIATFIFPDFYGNPVDKSIPPPGNPCPPNCLGYIEIIRYSGITSLLLLPFGLFYRKFKEYWQPVFFVLLSIILGLFVMGAANPLFHFFKEVPYLYTTNPTRSLIFLDLAFGILAGLGFTRLEQNSKLKSKLTVGIISFVFLMLVLSYFSNSYENELSEADIIWILVISSASVGLVLVSHWKYLIGRISVPGLALVAILISDLGMHFIDYNTYTSSDISSMTPPAIEFLRSDTGLYRTLPLGNLYEPNTLYLYGIEDLHGYIPHAIPQETKDLYGLIGNGDYFHKYYFYNVTSLPILSILNTKYLIYPSSSHELTFPLYSADKELVAFNGRYAVSSIESYSVEDFKVTFSFIAREIVKENRFLFSMGHAVPGQIGIYVDGDGRLILETTDENYVLHDYYLYHGLRENKRYDVQITSIGERYTSNVNGEVTSGNWSYTGNSTNKIVLGRGYNYYDDYFVGDIFDLNVSKISSATGQAGPVIFTFKSSVSVGDKSILLHKPYDKEVDIYENAFFLPRAFALEGADPGDITGNPEKDLRLLMEMHKRISPVSIVESSNSRISMIADANVPSFVILSNTFDSNWMGFIDGESVPIQKTFYNLQGLEITEGTHSISLVYSTVGTQLFWLGVMSSYIILGLIAVYWIVSRNKAHRKIDKLGEQIEHT